VADLGLFEDFINSFSLLISSSEVWYIAALSFFVSTTAVLISSVIGIPLGVYFGLRKGKPRLLPVSLLNTGMGLPPVLVGLVVFLLLMRKGPLGTLELVFTPSAMIIAQSILTLPIILGITRSTIKELPQELPEMLLSLGATRNQQIIKIIGEARSGILIGVIVALGRAFSEVGAIMIVGGNIRYHTRVLTTAIITEVSRGDRSMALAIGIILMSISFSLTAVMTTMQLRSSNN
jgi:ABC-type tungstate transport system substrate-binding protein